MIVTTHNTLLLSEFELKDSIYFIDIDENANKTIKALTDYDFRIQPGSNILMNYLQSNFMRLPWIDMDIDFEKM